MRLLDDAEWLREKYARDGERTIARELGVSRGTVRRRLQAHGIVSAESGRRRGARQLVAAYSRQAGAPELIAARIVEEQQRQPGPARTLTLIADRVRALHDASCAGDERDTDEALVSLASACGLVLDHRARLRAA